MELTATQLNRATLERQLLLRRRRLPVTGAARHIVALQAQEPASPYVALWNRVEGFEPTELDEAFASRSIVKASLMRITLHAVAADDYPVFHEAMLANLRASRLNDRRFTSTGLTSDAVDRVVPHLVEFASEPRASADIQAFISEHLGEEPEPRVWWALRTFAPLVHAPTGGPWSFGTRPSYRAAPSHISRVDPETSLQRLLWRYLEGFGPATARDFGQFALQRQSEIKPALAALRQGLVTYQGPVGEVLYDVPGAPIPDEDTAAPPRLLGMWDSILLAYADRSRILPAEYRRVVIQRNGDVLATVLVDGYVAGAWRVVGEGIEVKAFQPLSEETWSSLNMEAKNLLDMFAARDPDPYSRYARWWPRLPEDESRRLPS